MAPFIFFTALFLCGLLNSYFKLSSRLKKIEPGTGPEPEKIKPAETADDELETIFSTFDSDGDGFITLDELQDSLRRLRLPVTAHEAEAMMGRVDANGDGLIDMGEFRQLYDTCLNGKEVGLREAFEVFDGNRDGVITVVELREVLVSMGALKAGTGEVEEEDCRDMIRRVDLDGDGKVNFEEFKNMMLVKN